MFVLVVGPSGAGKDTLLRGAMAALATDPRFIFARRVITRPAQQDAEDHDTLSEAAFHAAQARGDFAMHWEAHGLHYGVPRAYAAQAAGGDMVIVNGSRSALAQILGDYPDSRVVLITVSPEERARRLTLRGRETATDIDARVSRATPPPPAGTVVVDNSANPEAGVAALVAALRHLSEILPA